MSINYTLNNLLANDFRSAGFGFAGAVILESLLVYSKRGGNQALLPGLSAFCLLVTNLICVAFDIAAPVSCTGRQALKVHILTFSAPRLRYISYATFLARCVSLIYSLTQYFDVVSPNLVCATGFPLTVLIAEKVILIVFNLSNLAIITHLAYSSGEIMKKTFGKFLVKDGITFVLALVLDILFVIAVGLGPSGYSYSISAALGNGISCFVLYIQNALVVATRMKNSSNKSPSGVNKSGSNSIGVLPKGTATPI